MAVNIRSNIASYGVQRNLARTTRDLASTSERLASGLRINRARDDAAGLAISSDLNVSARVYAQGVRNFNDAQSFLSIADDTVSQLSNIVIRLQELAEQAANGTLGSKQRSSLDAEAQALSKEYFRISRVADFNGMKLFDGSLANGVQFLGGFGSNAYIQSSLGGALGTGTFDSPVSYALNTTAVQTGILAGDLNGDGFADAITAGETITVQLSRADGTFSTPTSYGVAGFALTQSALADLNGDGILDVIGSGAAGGPSGQVVLLGNGDGTFRNAISGLNSTATIDFSMADVNGDGILDFVSGEHDTLGNMSLSIRFGNGNGTFRSGISYAMPSIYAESGMPLQFADVDRDGALDIVLGGNLDALPGAGRIYIFRGTGSGTFNSPVSLSSSYYVNDVSMADVNGDGLLDILTASDDANSYAGYVTVRLQRQNGTFGTESDFAFGTQIGHPHLAIADINGDGALDAVVNDFISGVTTLLGNGDGSFRTGMSYTVAGDFALGDFSGDGVTDIIGLTDTDEMSSFRARTTDGIHPLLPFSLRSIADARQALPVFKQRLSQLSQQRGKIGALQSRLSTATANLETARENFTAASDRIASSDVAEDAAEFTRLKILQNAAAAVLASANQQPGLALQLLQSSGE